MVVACALRARLARSGPSRSAPMDTLERSICQPWVRPMEPPMARRCVAFLTPRIEAWVFIACSPQSPHALGWRFMASESGPPIRWTVGWMGAGDSWAYGTSSLRMTTPGPYMEGQWRPQWTWHGRSHQGVILVKIRPSGILWTGRYAFQSAQK